MTDDRPAYPAASPWAGVALFGFLLNFVWELLQVPFYSGMERAPHWEATLFCLRATIGDVAIVVVAYGAVAVRFGASWLAEPTVERLATFVGFGLLATGVIELLSVHLWGRWSYAAGVPTVLGVGLPPVLQWVLLPPVILWLTRRHYGLFGEPQ